MNLTELDAARDRIQLELDLLLAQTGGEVTPEVDALCERLLCLDEQTADKFDSYGHVIHDLASKQAAYAVRAKSLAARASSLEKTAERMKDRLKEFMERHEMPKVEGEWYRFRVQNNGGKVPLLLDEVRAEDLPPVYRREVVNTEAIRSALESGARLSFAKLGERQTHLRIE